MTITAPEATDIVAGLPADFLAECYKEARAMAKEHQCSARVYVPSGLLAQTGQRRAEFWRDCPSRWLDREIIPVFGPSPDLRAVMSRLESHGFTVTWHPGEGWSSYNHLRITWPAPAKLKDLPSEP